MHAQPTEQNTIFWPKEDSSNKEEGLQDYLLAALIVGGCGTIGIMTCLCYFMHPQNNGGNLLEDAQFMY